MDENGIDFLCFFPIYFVVLNVEKCPWFRPQTCILYWPIPKNSLYVYSLKNLCPTLRDTLDDNGVEFLWFFLPNVEKCPWFRPQTATRDRRTRRTAPARRFRWSFRARRCTACRRRCRRPTPPLPPPPPPLCRRRRRPAPAATAAARPRRPKRSLILFSFLIFDLNHRLLMAYPIDT